MRQINVKRIHPGAKLPVRATPVSAGLDLYARLDEPITLEPCGRAIIPTGIAVEIEPGWAGFVFARSGLGIRHGIVPSNAVGVIDADYRGEIHVGLQNHGDAGYTIEPDERIAQLILIPVAGAEVVERETLSDTPRGSGGFGSTGKA